MEEFTLILTSEELALLSQLFSSNIPVTMKAARIVAGLADKVAALEIAPRPVSDSPR